MLMATDHPGDVYFVESLHKGGWEWRAGCYQNVLYPQESYVRYGTAGAQWLHCLYRNGSFHVEFVSPATVKAGWRPPS